MFSSGRFIRISIQVFECTHQHTSSQFWRYILAFWFELHDTAEVCNLWLVSPTVHAVRGWQTVDDVLCHLIGGILWFTQREQNMFRQHSRLWTSESLTEHCTLEILSCKILVHLISQIFSSDFSTLLHKIRSCLFFVGWHVIRVFV